MALSADDFRCFDAALGAPGEAEDILAGWRIRFPGVSLTRCDAADMSGERPFREYPGCYLYLVDGSGHCWRITDDPSAATGVVVASRR